MRTAKNITYLVGETPLVRMTRLGRDLPVDILLKLEYFNPGGSVKDRIALAMIEAGEREGKIGQGTVIVEATSGNTGIGLAMVAAQRGYRLVLTMPEGMSAERKKLLKFLGAELVLTPAANGMAGAVAKAEDLGAKFSSSFIPRQFCNEANPYIHRLTTGEEIWRDTDGKIDIFVSGVGTGGTITGVGELLKERNERVRIIAVEPEKSPVLSGGKPSVHRIQGIGAGFIPDVLKKEMIDEIILAKDEDAVAISRKLAREEGIFAGISSGANVWAGLEVAKRASSKGKLMVILIPDSAERYLSTDLFGDI